MGQGNHPVPHDLSTLQRYKGPLIKPLVPNYVADKITYKESLNIAKMTNMELIKINHDMRMKSKKMSITD